MTKLEGHLFLDGPPPVQTASELRKRLSEQGKGENTIFQHYGITEA